MNKTPDLFYKSIVIGVIILFMGAGIQPAFATVCLDSDNSELEEIIFQICKTDSITNHSIMITQQQLYELNFLIENFKEKIDSAETYEQTVVIYQDMIESLDRNDLLPEDLSVKKAEDMTINGSKKILDSIFTPLFLKGLNLDTNTNLLCLISSDTTDTAIFGPATITSLILFFLIPGLIIELSFKFKLLGFLFDSLFIPSLGLLALLTLLTIFSPLKFFNIIGYGRHIENPWEGSTYSPAVGWINTFGISGKKNWNESFYGQYLPFPYPFYNYFYTGTIGFTGFNIIRFIDEDLRCFSIGSAIGVKIGENHS